MYHHVLTNNAATLDIQTTGAQYTLIPTETGGAVDDAYLYRFQGSGDHGLFGCDPGSEKRLEAKHYLAFHDLALLWARANRFLIARRFLEALNVACEPILDTCHNSVTRIEIDGEVCRLHCKGAAPESKIQCQSPDADGVG